MHFIGIWKRLSFCWKRKKRRSLDSKITSSSTKRITKSKERFWVTITEFRVGSHLTLVDNQTTELTELQQRVAYLEALRQDESKKYSNQPNGKLLFH
jgi:hypothetical protein